MIVQSIPFVRTALRMWSGAIVWAAHFAAIYSVTALACARGYAHARFFGLELVTLAVLAATLLAFLAALAIVRRARRADAASFESWITATVASLAAIGIVWEGFVPVVMLPACG